MGEDTDWRSGMLTHVWTFWGIFPKKPVRNAAEPFGFPAQAMK